MGTRKTLSVKSRQGFQASNLSLPSNKVVKVKLSRIIRSNFSSKIPIIQEIVNRVSTITTHTYQFLKMFCIDYCQKNNQLPTIDKTFIMLIMKTVSGSSSGRSGRFKETNLTIKDQLELFYDNTYINMIEKSEYLKYDGLTQMLDYECTNIITSYHNHIKNHFYKFLCRYVNLVVDLSNKEKAFRDKCKIDKTEHAPLINELRSKLFTLKSDIYQSTDKCDPILNNIKKHVRETILNNINIKHALYGDVKNNIKADPLKLLFSLLKMSIFGEQLVRSRLSPEEKDKKFNIINCFPIRTSIIPKYVKIDTVMLIQLLVNKNKRFYQSNITSQKDFLWSQFFKTGKRVFKKTNYKFSGSILTDGLSACICFDLKDQSKKNKKNKIAVDNDKTKYISELSDDIKKRLEIKTFIGIDPGWSDLIFCTNGITNIITKKNGKKVRKTVTFRYSRQQRRKELKIKRYRDILDNDKKNTIIKGSNIKQIETILSQFNSNSCNLDRCKEFTRIKNKINFELKEYYQKDIHRQLKWYSYLNKMKSDANMINGFRDKFGSPEKSVILMGDFSKTEVLKGSEPVKGKSIRKLFTNAGYELYLVNEFNTSQKMYETGEQLEKFRKRESSRPYKKGTVKTVHGLLRIKSETSNSCSNLMESNNVENVIPENSTKAIKKTTIINRDLNGALNIRLKGICQIKNEQIPEYFKRTQKIKIDDIAVVKAYDMKDNDNNVKIIKRMPKKQITKKITSNKIVRVRKTINPSDFIGPDKKRLGGRNLK
jgi:hypothetical protein